MYEPHDRCYEAAVVYRNDAYQGWYCFTRIRWHLLRSRQGWWASSCGNLKLQCNTCILYAWFACGLRWIRMRKTHLQNRVFWLYHKQPKRSLCLYHKQSHRFFWLYHKQPNRSLCLYHKQAHRFWWWYQKQLPRFCWLYHKQPHDQKHSPELRCRKRNVQSSITEKQKEHENQQGQVHVQHACLPCRKRSYALACIGSATILCRYQEWAMPYLTCVRADIHLRNEFLAVLMLKTGRYIKAFLYPFDIKHLYATSRLKAPRNPDNHEVCSCLMQVFQGGNERLTRMEGAATRYWVQRKKTSSRKDSSQKSSEKCKNLDTSI